MAISYPVNVTYRTIVLPAPGTNFGLCPLLPALGSRVGNSRRSAQAWQANACVQGHGTTGIRLAWRALKAPVVDSAIRSREGQPQSAKLAPSFLGSFQFPDKAFIQASTLVALRADFHGAGVAMS